MSDQDDIDEDISSLEDNPAEQELESSGIAVETGKNHEPIEAGTPVYRLRLFYSNETFLAVYKGDALPPTSMVLVPTRYGRDLAQVIGQVHRNSTAPLSDIAWIERPASKDDLEQSAYNQSQEKDAFRICKEMIEEHKLEMKLVSVHYLLEESKILFFFTAENRVDFRELVKDMVGIFKSRIELRQIGVRDEARVVGGLGVCGRCYCCHAVSDKLKPVSIKMAKDQNLSLNSMKISGPCGRLLCCLAYEHNFYSETRRQIPPEGARISYGDTTWRVMEVNVVMGRLKISAEDGRLLTVPASSFEKAEGRWRLTGAPELAALSSPAGTVGKSAPAGEVRADGPY
jgi:cell fate regulator YaaT (PSP1 superfamily)